MEKRDKAIIAIVAILAIFCVIFIATPTSETEEEDDEQPAVEYAYTMRKTDDGPYKGDIRLAGTPGDGETWLAVDFVVANISLDTLDCRPAHDIHWYADYDGERHKISIRTPMDEPQAMIAGYQTTGTAWFVVPSDIDVSSISIAVIPDYNFKIAYAERLLEE